VRKFVYEAEMTSRVSERSQITIDRVIRKRLGVRPGMVAHQRAVDGHLEVIFLPEPHRESLYGVLHEESEEPKVLNPDELEEAVMEAVAQEHQEGDNYA
jgi:bifunctional DNA-binding transcriptional regulator/antitoxin component of YhaV-PrlF toxin-antitoxin module